MNRKGILFVISGPSGVGKGTIKDVLLDKNKEINLSISATTRGPRLGEIDGREYFFINETEFQAMVDNEQFLEWANVYSHRYGTPRKFVSENMQKGRDVLLEIDIQGALQVKNTLPEGVFVFIAPPSFQELQLRLCNRGKDSKESIAERLSSYEREMRHLSDYDYVVINDEVENAVRQVQAIIIAEHCKITNLEI